jgi:hypothetical protein
MPGVSENTEAKALVRWVEMEHGDTLKIAHFANEVPTLPATAKHLTAMGVRRGVPDYMIVNKLTHKVCFVELKKRIGGKASPDQLVWISALGKRARVCHGWREAAKFITSWLL